MRRPLLMNNRIAIVVPDCHANRRRVDVAVTEDEKSTEAGLRDEVEDTVEDGFGVGRDDVATFAETPGYGVQNPEECGKRATHHEAAAYIAAVARGVLAGFPDEHVEDVEHCNAA